MARITSLFEDEAAGFEAQQRDLKAAGVERLFSERTSAVGPRIALEEALDFAREGDAIVVTKLDRLARSVADLVRIVERQRASGCASSRCRFPSRTDPGFPLRTDPA
jgi:DNA invertase Pin-like site-specific DNA recombinase